MHIAGMHDNRTPTIRKSAARLLSAKYEHTHILLLLYLYAHSLTCGYEYRRRKRGDVKKKMMLSSCRVLQHKDEEEKVPNGKPQRKFCPGRRRRRGSGGGDGDSLHS